MSLQIQLTVKSLPLGIREALARCGYNRPTINVRGATEAHLVAGDPANTSSAHRVDDNATGSYARFVGAFGGRNGFNKPRAKSTPDQWDPDFDDDAKPVPENGAIVCACGRYATVTVRPELLAQLVAPGSHDASVARDAALDGNTAAVETLVARAVESSLPSLTSDEQAVVYAYCGLRSCDERKEIASKLAGAVDALVSRGLLKRASNGATAATPVAKAFYSVKRAECERSAARVTRPWALASEGAS